MACEVCKTALSRTLIQDYEANRWNSHQPDFQALSESSDRGCPLCACFRRFVLRCIAEDSRPARLRWRSPNDMKGFMIRSRFVNVDHPDGLDMEVCSQITLGLRNGAFGGAALFRLEGDHPWLPMRTVPRDLNFNIAKMWVEQCTSRHRSCPKLQDVELPTRLIHVGSSIEEPRLVETGGMKGRYIALSHCWGGFSPPKTQHNNFQERLASIPFATLPKTFQDAITVVRSIGLGISYLWIDSFCILQGDAADFQRECARMHLTFSNAALTICAPRASNPHAGLLHERKATDICANTATVQVNIGGHFVNLSITEERHEGTGSTSRKEMDAVAFSRAWIVQERLLSPRILFFGTNKAYMECSNADFFEHLAVALIPAQYPESKASLKHMPRPQLAVQWRNIVEEYTTCDLTAADDRLPALSGTARKFHEFAQTSYHAGLWRDRFVLELAWRRKPRARIDPTTVAARRSSKPATITPPSWSWASCDYGVAFFIEGPEQWLREAAEVVEISAPPIGLDPYGQVDRKSSYIRLRGLCKIAVAQQHMDEQHIRSDSHVRSVDPADYGDWVYSIDSEDGLETELSPVAQMYKDDLDDSVHGKLVHILYLASEHQPGSDLPTYWAAMVLEMATDDTRRKEIDHKPTYRRVGILTARMRDPDLDLEGARQGVWAWSWMQSGEEQTMCIV